MDKKVNELELVVIVLIIATTILGIITFHQHQDLEYLKIQNAKTQQEVSDLKYYY